MFPSPITNTYAEEKRFKLPRELSGVLLGVEKGVAE